MSASARTGGLPRLIRPDVLWSGGCLDSSYAAAHVHGHFSMFAIRGSEKTILIDTGHPMHAEAVDRDIKLFLDGRPLDYVFATHAEFPHAGLMGQWLRKYPNLTVLGNQHDYGLYYPEHRDRIRTIAAGDSVDLGNRRLVFVPAVWRDLTDTLWAFDTLDRILFVSDAFAYLHPHQPGQCDFMISEHPVPDLKMIQYFNERAMQWTKFTDARITFSDMDRLLQELKPQLLAGAHGGVVDRVENMLPLFKEGMIMGGAESTLGTVTLGGDPLRSAPPR